MSNRQRAIEQHFKLEDAFENFWVPISILLWVLTPVITNSYGLEKLTIFIMLTGWYVYGISTIFVLNLVFRLVKASSIKKAEKLDSLVTEKIEYDKFVKLCKGQK